ncbi:MAG: lipopolysaccharide biosynthesis protein, partial [Mesorhizobium sp.]
QQALEAKVAGMKSKSLDTDQASVKLRELQRDLEAVRSVYATYLQRAQETREQVNVDSTNARIISDAMPALKKSWPPLLLLVFGAFFGGL